MLTQYDNEHICFIRFINNRELPSLIDGGSNEVYDEIQNCTKD